MCKQVDLPLDPLYPYLGGFPLSARHYRSCDTKVYGEELYVGIYLNMLHPSIVSKISGSFLSSNRVPSLTITLSTALQVTNVMPLSPLSSTLSNTLLLRLWQYVLLGPTENTVDFDRRADLVKLRFN